MIGDHAAGAAIDDQRMRQVLSIDVFAKRGQIAGHGLGLISGLPVRQFDVLLVREHAGAACDGAHAKV